MTWTIEGQKPWYVEHPTSPSVTSVGIAKDGVIKAVAVSTTLEDAGDYIVAALNAYEATSPVDLLVGIKPLEWQGYEARSVAGCYRVQRLDDKWEPLRDGYYMLPKHAGVVAAFDNIDEAKAYAQADYERRIRSALAAASTVNNPATLEKSDFQKFDVEGERQENEQETPKQHVLASEQKPIDVYKAENAKHGWNGRQFGMQGAHLSLDRNGNAMILFEEDHLQYDESGPYITLSASEVVELRDYLADAFPVVASAEVEG